MTGAQVQAQTAGLGKGQHTSGCGDAAIPDDHSAIVEGGIGKEDIADQLLGNTAVDDRAGLEVLLQDAVSGKDDQRADSGFAHCLTGCNRLGNHRDHLLLRLLGTQEFLQLHTAQVIQHSAQLRLEQNDQGQKTDGQELIQHKIQRMQFCNARQPGDGQDEHHHLCNTGGIGCLKDRYDLIYQKCNNDDVQSIHKLDAEQVGPQ